MCCMCKLMMLPVLLCQLVVVHFVLHLAHTVPWAGHLGQQKTYARISSRFHWPTLYTDVLAHCNTCTTCQKTSAVPQRSRVPLQPLPVISEPFRRIAMDIVGPLEEKQCRSSVHLSNQWLRNTVSRSFPTAYHHHTEDRPFPRSTLLQGRNTRGDLDGPRH